MTDTTPLPRPPARSPEDEAQDLRLLEAILFAAAEPLDEATIAQRMPDGVDLPARLAELEAAYRARGVNLLRLAGKWALRTAPDLAPRLMIERVVPRKLSRAAIEALAIIAYHQPVTRAEIEEIRGVAISKGTLDTLMESNWIRPKGRRQTPGRPATWVTTEEFLVHFGLDGLGDLPGVEELKAAGLLDTRPGASLGDNSEAAGPTSIEERADDEPELDFAVDPMIDDPDDAPETPTPPSPPAPLKPVDEPDKA